MYSKKMGLIASAAALCAVSSFAQNATPGLVITGVVDTGYATTNHVINSKGEAAGKSGGTDSILGVSNIGFSGGKDLGQGSQAFYNFQMGFNPSQGKLSSSDTSNVFSRNAYIGLKGQPGSLSIGKQWNFNDDWLVGSVFKGGYNSGSIFKFSEFDAVSDIYDNTIKYVSHDMGGLQLGGMYGSSYKTMRSDKKTNVEGGTMSNLGLKYSAGPWHVAATTFSEKSGDLGGTYRLNTLGASFAVSPVVKLRAGQSTSKIDAGTYLSVGDYSSAGTDAKATSLGVDFVVQPKLTLSLDALRRKNSVNTDDTTRVSRLLAVYAWRPDISLVANYATLSNSTNSTQTLVGSTDAGLSQHSLALGVRMTF